ncbi:hypothetical protein [Falsiroseomonas sp. HW251]|uniref:hypothetical protein n=1 Tax=Falsiroseomonas sp. HW251 TaxID=3390998 RepID=UPI003D30F3B1
MKADLPLDPAGKFEMEDQRNWSDASFKTYVGSLLDPWPYRLEPGVARRQRVEVAIMDDGPASPGIATGDATPQLEIGDAGATMSRQRGSRCSVLAGWSCRSNSTRQGSANS